MVLYWVDLGCTLVHFSFFAVAISIEYQLLGAGNGGTRPKPLTEASSATSEHSSRSGFSMGGWRS